MKTRKIATLTALTLSAFAGNLVRAGEPAALAQLASDIEVIVVTAKRPATLITDEAPASEAVAVAAAPATTDENIEVIVVTATRADQLAAIRELALERRERMLARAAEGPQEGTWKNWAGMPMRW